jgi:hypothetical protein
MVDVLLPVGRLKMNHQRLCIIAQSVMIGAISGSSPGKPDTPSAIRPEAAGCQAGQKPHHNGYNQAFFTCRLNHEVGAYNRYDGVRQPH